MNIIPAAPILLRMAPRGGPDLLDKQRRWVHAVLAARRQLPSDLAAAANLSASTLTRFLNDPAHPHGLSARTVEAIEQATGFVAYELPSPLSNGHDHTAPDAVEFVSADAAGALSRSVKAMIGGNPGLSAWELTARSLETVGYFPGDVLIVDPGAKPQAGDPVCAVDRRHGQSHTVMRIFHAPMLVGATLNPTALDPMVVDDRSVVIRGVVVGMIRARANRPLPS